MPHRAGNNQDWRSSRAFRYGFAVTVTALATLLRWALPGPLTGTPYLAFYPAVAVAAAFGGMGPGLLATIASAGIVDLFFDLSPGRFEYHDPVALLRLAIFLAGGTSVSLIARVQREAQARERRQTEIARFTGERFRAIFDRAGVGILEADLNDRFIATNDRACQILGYTREELLGRTVHELTAPEDRARSDELNAGLHAGSSDRFDNEKRYLHRDGSPIWVHVTVSALRNADGSFRGSIATLEDISQRKAAEAALRDSEEQLRMAALAAGIGVWSWVPGTTQVMVSAHWRRLFGISREAPVTFETWQNSLHPEDRDRTVAEIKAASAEHREFNTEYRVVWPDGTLRWIVDRGRASYDESGNAVAMAGVNVDITERKRFEEELKAAKTSAEYAKATAEEANRAKDHFLAVLSHELRTPLTPVLATISLLQEESRYDSETHQHLEVVRRNVEMEARLIDDLLDLTRIARGKVRLNKQPVDLSTVLHRAAEVCRPDIEARRLHFGIECGPDAPYWVNADAARLQQVFWNLVKNAVKFTPNDGCVAVRCRRAGDTVQIEVQDSGEGIDPQDLQRIFNAFEQAQNSGQFGGLGLGLTISRRLIEMHDGTIQAGSDGKGRGATFTIRLPLLQGAAAQRAETPAPAAAQALPAARLRILLVEDHGDTARIMKRLLEKQGHEVQTAGDVATAVQYGTASVFDLLITDLGLPDGSGWDILRQVRLVHPQLQGIALSGYGMDTDVQRSRDAGFIDHLTKPVDLNTLRAVIERVGVRG